MVHILEFFSFSFINGVNLFKNFHSQYMESTIQYSPLGIHTVGNYQHMFVFDFFLNTVWIKHWGTVDDRRRYDRQKHRNHVIENIL